MTSGSRGEAGHSPWLSVSAEAWERQCMCVVCTHALALDRTGKADCVWHGSGGYGGGGWRGGSRPDETLCPEGNPLLSPNGCPFACVYYLCDCVCVCVFAYSHIIHLLNNFSCWLAWLFISIYVHIACHIVMCKSSRLYSLECVRACVWVCVCGCMFVYRQSFRGYSNKGMPVGGPRPWSALCSLSLLIFEE